jgi:uncharacterized OsmC-like protein
MTGSVRVRSSSRHRFVQELEAREHHWLADLPRESGGVGLGPTPLELLLGSFAARTGIGIFELAREKEWAVDAVEVELTASADPMDRLEGRLERRIAVRGELNEQERRELEGEVARRWPRSEWLPSGELHDSFSYD